MTVFPYAHIMIDVPHKNPHTYSMRIFITYYQYVYIIISINVENVYIIISIKGCLLYRSFCKVTYCNTMQ